MSNTANVFDHKKMAIAKWLGSGSINVFGRPFAGKDTQSNRLAGWLDAIVVGGGEILRSQGEAVHLKKIHGKGYLVPQKEYVAIITPYLKQTAFKGKPLILSSVGRWHGEEPRILEATDKANHPLKAVIYIDISPQVAIERLETSQTTRNREDDQHHILEVRLKEFAKKTMPVLAFYDNMDMLITVKGQESPDDVEKDIIDLLYNLTVKSV